MSTGQHDLTQSAPLFEQALELEPGNVECVWYGGLAALQNGDYATAYAHWLKLRDQDLPDDISAIVEQHLPELADKAGQTLPPKAPAAQNEDRTGQAAVPGAVLQLGVPATGRESLRVGVCRFVFVLWCAVA